MADDRGGSFAPPFVEHSLEGHRSPKPEPATRQVATMTWRVETAGRNIEKEKDRGLTPRLVLYFDQPRN